MESVNIYPVLATWQPNKNGECTIHLSIDLNGRRVAFPSMKRKVLPTYWDAENKKIKKSAPNADIMNAAIVKKKNELTGIILEAELREGNLTAKSIKDVINGKESGNFSQFFNEFLRFISTERKSKNAETQKFSDNNIKKWGTEYTRLVNYAGASLSFRQINIKWLEGYEEHCAQTLDKHTSLPVSMSRLLQVLRKADAKGLFDIKSISAYNLPAYVNPERPYLTVAQTENIADKIYSGSMDHEPTMKAVACFFLVECWAGIRLSDWGRFTIEKLIDKNSLKVQAKKNNQPVYVPLSSSPRLSKIIGYIRENNITFKVTDQQANRSLKSISVICAIPFQLTTHVGRHTCATLLLELGYSVEAVAQWLGISKKTVDIYAKQTRRKLMNEYEKFGGL